MTKNQIQQAGFSVKRAISICSGKLGNEGFDTILVLRKNNRGDWQGSSPGAFIAWGRDGCFTNPVFLSRGGVSGTV